ncbi:MAG: YihY/virulence factor BrkB family protein, partial [Tepidiformaceae bacterium]
MTLAGRAAGEFGRDHCSHLAAGISYYALFSIFPLLVFIAGVAGLVLQDADAERDLVDAILDSVPVDEDEGREDIEEAVHDLAGSSSGLLGLIGLVLTAWSASTMFGAVRRSISIAYDVEVHRPFVQQKLVDLGLLLAVAPFFLLSIALTGLVAFARDAAGDVSGLEWVADRRIAWGLVGVAISAGLSFLAFFVLYWLVPPVKVRAGDVWLGAAVAALLFEGVKAGFSLYLSYFGNYDVVFGTIGAVAGFLLWVYFSANILLLGAEIAVE